MHHDIYSCKIEKKKLHLSNQSYLTSDLQKGEKSEAQQ